MQKDTLYYCPVGCVAWSPHGEELPIKEHRGWRFVNINNTKVGISKLPEKIRIKDFDDFIFCYIFLGWFHKFPCPAMEKYIHLKLKKHK